MSLDGKENQSKYLDKDELAQVRFIVRSAVSKPDLIMSIRTYLSNIQKNKSTRQINRYINPVSYTHLTLQTICSV